jgi:hypothetical protein
MLTIGCRPPGRLHQKKSGTRTSEDTVTVLHKAMSVDGIVRVVALNRILRGTLKELFALGAGRTKVLHDGVRMIWGHLQVTAATLRLASPR